MLLQRATSARAARRVVSGAARLRAQCYSTSLADVELAAPQPAPLCALLEEEQAMAEAASRFARERVGPVVQSMDEAGKMEADVIDGLFEHGLMGIEIAEEHGGCGATFTAACLVVEELAKVDPAVSVMVDIHNTIINNCVSRWASPELQREWLPRLASDTLGSFCLSEAGSGSDAFALRCAARRDGDDYLLSGEKLWISNSAEAGVFLVMANAAPEKGHRGITCFVVPREAAGLRVGPKEDKLGIRASSTCPVLLDDVRVPASAVLGEVGAGYRYAIEILNEGRVGIGAQMVGLAQGALDRTLPYLHERRQFGTPLIEFQAVAHEVADLTAELHAARLLVYDAARRQETGTPLVKEAAMAKLIASRVAEKTASKCIELLGGVGFTKEYGVEKLYRDAKIGAIYEGTSNIQLNTIAKLVSAQYK
ncbi:long-chain specific acyl-CoA dehydrogenase [Emiliania huxleyi CCMP1516]|uniref:Short/branched chain specific acyl-CoA dehydrogenase, mitochondrial n=2 Tax=Emiliania huxleyi TaxID=2903 RepID=A0A0D3IQD1_EMIH1|nr:long-chain specific acyl-CoA dehydrogenase [Emiliania huxleyi CCMP1516]EOD13466.1 long-chain specific acyl-CoA dehydrogenase [Emiliania huxleyi CCMP1516]|eukprot:XP_005765895.1 long-chain specific acyl-CoA dehydrogenase [Emiliania huxleyi CCMP1516]